ncbi:MAG TPA: Arc family DNA-binding protein [Mycobacteriales bacterium]|nr:Arc family DNA-binding protein [Mycobacteriales bacterium]
MTWRAPDEVLDRVRAQAAAHGRSLNDWVTTVLAAASDPAAAGSEAAELRERMSRAGLLEEPAPRRVQRPSQEELQTARRAAGEGRPLSDFVSEGRG